MFQYGKQEEFEYAFSDIVAKELFNNQDAKKCPITTCQMMDSDCDEPYTGGIAIDNFGDFKIKAKTSFPGGRVHPVCVVCENIDMKVGIEINIDQ